MKQRRNSARERSGMEQRRFFEVRGEESGEWLVLDGKRHPPRVICRCLGWNAPKNAALIAAALEAYNSELYSRFPSTVRCGSMSSQLSGHQARLNLQLRPLLCSAAGSFVNKIELGKCEVGKVLNSGRSRHVLLLARKSSCMLRAPLVEAFSAGHGARLWVVAPYLCRSFSLHTSPL